MKLALVTGGGKRVGAAISGRLAEAGYALALHGRDDAAPEPGLRARLAQSGADWRGFEAELSDAGAVGRLVAAVSESFDAAPSLLVNSAAIFGQDDVAAMSAATLTEHFRVNTVAPLLLARDVAARASLEAPVAIVNILDQRVQAPNGDQASYTVSKLALAGATAQLARALAPAARVNAVAPGLVLPTEEYLPAQMVRLEAAMPLGSLPDPDDIADAVLYLAEARSVTGQTIFVDSGAHLKSFERDFLFM